MQQEDKEKYKKKIQSSIPELSVGDERKCFNQIRKASAYIQPESLLWNGWPAGKFALDYVIGHHMKRKRKAQEKEEIDIDPTKRKRNRKRQFEDPICTDFFENEMKLESEKMRSLRTDNIPIITYPGASLAVRIDS